MKPPDRKLELAIIGESDLASGWLTVLRDNSLMEPGFQCAGCGEWNSTTVDESAGRRQSYVEDCQVCCKPNVLLVEYDASSQEFYIAATLE
jgi:hypothetical protein